MITVGRIKVFLFVFLSVNVFSISMTGLFLKQDCRTGSVLVKTNINTTLQSRVAVTEEIKQSRSKPLTEELWKFPTYDVERVYLYKKLLTKEHSFNEINLENLRNELRKKFGTYFNNNFIIDKQNTPNNFTFKFGSEKNSRRVKIADDVHRQLPNNLTFGMISRCSIVGNSGSILHSRCGKEIDEADFVFRCNAAPIKPFKVDAGSKTNFTTFNPSIFRTRYRGYPNAEIVTRFLKDMTEYRGILWAPCFSADSMQICLNTTKLYNLTENNFVLGYPGHLQRVQTFWRLRGLRGRISTGFYLVNVALNSCRELHLYGFWPFLQDVDKTVKDIPYHFFDGAKHIFDKSQSIHDMRYEFSVLVQLHLLGVLRLHVGGCNH